MPLPDGVLEYIARKKECLGVSLMPSSDSTRSVLDTHGANYMRGYVGAGHRMSGEDADRRLERLMTRW
jgi:hypothetical protein